MLFLRGDESFVKFAVDFIFLKFRRIIGKYNRNVTPDNSLTAILTRVQILEDKLKEVESYNSILRQDNIKLRKRIDRMLNVNEQKGLIGNQQAASDSANQVALSRDNRQSIDKHPLDQCINNSSNAYELKENLRDTNNNIIYCGIPHRNVFPIVESIEDCFYILEKQKGGIARFSVNVNKSISLLESYDLSLSSVCKIAGGNINTARTIIMKEQGYVKLSAEGWLFTHYATITVE